MEINSLPRADAADWYQRYHYLGTLPSVSKHYGVYEPGLSAVVSVGYGTGAGMTRRYGLEQWPGNLEVTRVAVHPDCPANSASRYLAAVLKHVASSGIDWVYSYADTGRGHHGGIYQALNAVYVGMSKPHSSFLIGGQPVHTRTLYSRHGTSAHDAMRAIYGDRIEHVMTSGKHTYILPVGTMRSRYRIRQQLAPFALEYPGAMRHVA
jgi:hypothetical protein